MLLGTVMATKGEVFAGLTVAMITPFRDGQVDFSALLKLVDWHVEQGTDCLVPVGTTGESPTLDHEEHERVIAAVTERAAGRIKVMPGTGSNNTREAIRLTKFAKRAGATGALLIGPYYNKPTQEGYYRHFAAVAEAVDLPLVLYNIPGRTASNILPETMARLARLGPIVGVKESTGSLDQASQIAALCDLTILSGDDSLTLPLMSIGAVGVISVAANIIPAQIKRMVTLAQQSHYADAAAIHRRVFPFIKALFLDCNPMGIKYAMKLANMDTGEMRLPLWEASEATKKLIEQQVKRLGVTSR